MHGLAAPITIKTMPDETLILQDSDQQVTP